MNHPVSEFVASLVGVENLIHGRVTKQKEKSFVASVSGHDIEAMGAMESGDHVVLCIRPENVILSPPHSETNGSPGNSFPATVERIMPMGPYQKVLLNCGFSLVAYVANPSFSELSPKNGTEVLASFKAQAVHAIRGA
jgi:tungstate transport system ATP-binding protein